MRRGTAALGVGLAVAGSTVAWAKSQGIESLGDIQGFSFHDPREDPLRSIVVYDKTPQLDSKSSASPEPKPVKPADITLLRKAVEQIEQSDPLCPEKGDPQYFFEKDKKGKVNPTSLLCLDTESSTVTAEGQVVFGIATKYNKFINLYATINAAPEKECREITSRLQDFGKLVLKRKGHISARVPLRIEILVDPGRHSRCDTFVPEPPKNGKKPLIE